MATKTITANGNAQIDTAQSKFGGASGLFDGTGDYLSIPDSSDFEFGSGDFTIDFWFRMNSLTNSSLYSHGNNSGTDYANFFFWNTGGGRFALNMVSGGSTVLDFQCNAALSTGTWYHIELTRSGNTWYVFINGVSATLTLNGGSYSNAYPNLPGSVRIGSQDNNTTYLNGWVDEYRISKGIARHTSNFTPPTTPYMTDDYTVLLAHMDGADGSTSFLDSSIYDLNLGEYLGAGQSTTKLLLHLNGNSFDYSGNGNNGTDTAITYSQANGKFGQGAGFNGSTSIISINSKMGFTAGANNISYMAWVNVGVAPTSGKNSGFLFSQLCSNPGGSGTRYFYRLVYQNNAGTLGLTAFGRGTFNVTLTPGTWYHVALTSDTSNNNKIYLNGVLVASNTAGDSAAHAATEIDVFSIGAVNFTGTAVDFLNGKIDEVITENVVWSPEKIKKYYTCAKGRYGII